MKELDKHNDKLRDFFTNISNVSNDELLSEKVSLDSIENILRKVLPVQEMRLAGVFTGDKLATRLVNSFERKIDSNSFVLDPTCGTGNLLIACSRNLPVFSSLSETLQLWGAILSGFDLYPSFIESTKLRLILEAVNRGCKPDCSIEDAILMFSRIIEKDTMSLVAEDVCEITHVVMNPPFAIWESPKRDFWKKGKVNSAAIIMEHYLRLLSKASEISAVLPEVLRSGSRYQGWRTFVDGVTVSANAEIVGRFNSKTDVDVFLFKGIIGQNQITVNWVKKIIDKDLTLETYFDVSVGRLVAYRDPEEGEQYKYLHTKNAPAWGEASEINEERRFKGTVISPPFVVVRRTSRPDDKYRAVGTLVSCQSNVAVENHLIIIKPKNNSIRRCRTLMKVLKSESTNDYLNDRIRCRHLTVGAVKLIPYKE